MSDGNVHYDNPFSDPPGERSTARRLRGRLALPVTVWTATGSEGPVGLTVSSLLVADGDPPLVLGLVGETSDFYTAVTESRLFVVHVLREEDARLAEIFAGLRPSPGGPFAGIEVDDSDWGPAIRSHGTRAFCRWERVEDAGYHKLLTARVEAAHLDELDSPAVFFRGRFRRLAPDVRRPLT